MTKLFNILFLLTASILLAQDDAVINEINGFKSDQEKLDFLGRSVSRMVYASPEKAVLYASIFDSIKNNVPTLENRSDALMYNGMASHASQDFENAI